MWRIVGKLKWIIFYHHKPFDFTSLSPSLTSICLYFTTYVIFSFVSILSLAHIPIFLFTYVNIKINLFPTTYGPPLHSQIQINLHRSQFVSAIFSQNPILTIHARLHLEVLISNQKIATNWKVKPNRLETLTWFDID